MGLFGPPCSRWQLLTSIIPGCMSLEIYANCTHRGEIMPKLPYPPSTRPDAAQHALLRVLGGVLTFVSILLALLGIIFHQRVPDLILATIVGSFALRVLILWLGAKPWQHEPIAGRPSREWVRYPPQSPPYTPGQPTPFASPDSPTQPLPRLAAEQHVQQRGNDHGTT